MKKKDIVFNVISVNLNLIGVRMLDNEIVRRLIELLNIIIVVLFVNISGRLSLIDL